ncbi:MAG: PepSY domain-containing protein [Kofleriaceae bacterium]
MSKSPRTRRVTIAAFHRWAAIVLVALLVVWSITGLLFHLKPGWDRAYDSLSVQRTEPVDLSSVVPVASLTSVSLTSSGAVPSSIELFSTVLGPMYRVTTSAGSSIVDATTGRVRTFTPDEVIRLVDDAVSRSPFARRYGAHVGIDGNDVRYAGDQVVTFSPPTMRVSQEGRDTKRIDWLYRIHYLQWTGNKTIDKILAISGLALIWIVMIPGVVLFVRRLRRAAP